MQLDGLVSDVPDNEGLVEHNGLLVYHNRDRVDSRAGHGFQPAGHPRPPLRVRLVIQRLWPGNAPASRGIDPGQPVQPYALTKLHGTTLAKVSCEAANVVDPGSKSALFICNPHSAIHYRRMAGGGSSRSGGRDSAPTLPWKPLRRRRIEAGQPVIINGDGSQRRDLRHLTKWREPVTGSGW